MNKINIGLVAGESSGDILGANLMNSLKKYIPNINFFGISGPCMKKEGMESWYNIDELSIIGLTEIIKKIPRILFIRNNLIKRFIKLNINVFIGIDSPDFNIFLEKKLKKSGIKVIHYISPSIWAWRKNRIFKIKNSVDQILSFLPFEKKIYDKFNIPCKFIGHILADNIPLKPNKKKARKKLNISSKSICLAILPGSRFNEIKNLTKTFLYSAKILKNLLPKLKILIPFINKDCEYIFNKIYYKYTPEIKIKKYFNQSHTVMIASDVALVASGTSTLECMLAKCPMVVGYKVNFFTFLIAKILIKIPWISLPNIIANKKLVKEFLQKECNPKNLSKELYKLLINKNNNKILLKNFYLLHKKIRCNANKKATRAVIDLIYSK
ncbi:lipid-A-disaccharide synthase [Sodalis-like secondary symbiont of Drepanosiphum platanoidis]|uniref:lipid-A-disaccharide synthase n=1 Tax=Sodalis-like secondary symbiont of Drepanosiphum platanoidis TaxID=2994493 RepID=UPI003463C292